METDYADIPVDNVFGVSLPKKIQEVIEKKSKLKNILKNFQENRWANQYALRYFNAEVKQDIEIIEEFKKFYGKGPLIKPWGGDELIDMYDYIKDKYSMTYCPNCFFEDFNQSNKMRYMLLRIEIDKLLGIKDVPYKI